ncbi:hypothetical protein HYX13_01365 [Candidatus Woesearchaeota archaeon]|nr:hypothetical protein [Candidatus Woesearchaeota archaeon]
MVKIEILLKEGKLGKISELELERYINFFSHSYQDNLAHGKAVLETFPRWSIISGYYAMHDITKLLLAKKFRLKVEFEVHATTIKVLKELIENKEIQQLIEKGYQEFISLANDLAEAKKERVKSQYYTGTEYFIKDYQRRAKSFLKELVEPYLLKINALLEEQ